MSHDRKEKSKSSQSTPKEKSKYIPKEAQGK
jgi:hypothetical protein